MSATIDLSGTVFGRLTVLRRSGSDENGRAAWECICVCGAIILAVGKTLRNGDIKSCGCLQKELLGQRSKVLNTVHGLSEHRLYRTWHSMMTRCHSPKHRKYADYGGRGIEVCERWKTVENFIEDMYPSFVEGLTLDRTDNDKGYSPDNCRWATPKEQSANQRPRRRVT